MNGKNEFVQEKEQMAEMIKRVRAYANLSQRDLSRLSGVSQSDISRIERGVANPSLYTISRIMSATGTSLFFDYSVNGKSNSYFIEGWESKLDDKIAAVVKTSAESVIKSIGEDVKNVILFGSCARGDNTETSDIDFRIDKGRVQGLQMAALLLDLEDALQKPVDLISTGAMDQQFLEKISKEEKLIYAGK